MPNIPKLLASKLGKRKDLGYRALTLVSVTPGARGAVLSAGNNATSVSVSCKGTMKVKSSLPMPGSGIERAVFSEFSIFCVSTGGVAPKPGDRIIDSRDGKTYTIDVRGVTSGQIGVFYFCRCSAPGV